jgi:hypothetical protein
MAVERIAVGTAKIDACPSWRTPELSAKRGRQLFSGGHYQMHARPQVREILIRKKMQRWLMIAKYPFIDRSCPTWRARKNYQRLCAKYPEIMQQVGLTDLSAF